MTWRHALLHWTHKDYERFWPWVSLGIVIAGILVEIGKRR